MPEDYSLAVMCRSRDDGLVIEWLYRDEDEVLSPEAVAVLYYLGQAHPERMPWVAAHWLASGYGGEDLVRMAGLHGDDPREVGDVLPGALLDCGARLPDSDIAAAGDVFTRVARRHLDGRAGAGQVVFVAGAVLAWLGYPEDVLSLPLGRLADIEDEWDEWDEKWGRPQDTLAAIVRDACEQQLARVPDVPPSPARNESR